MEFTKRTVAPMLDPDTTPAEQMAKMISRKRVQAEKMTATLQAERKLYADILTELALDIHRKRHFEYAASFRTLSAILERGGVEIRTYEGDELTDEMREELNIVQWLPPETEETDRVVEAFEPEVRVRGELTHRAKLICREGKENSAGPEIQAEPAETVAAETAAADGTVTGEKKTVNKTAPRATKPGPVSNKRKKKAATKKKK